MVRIYFSWMAKLKILVTTNPLSSRYLRIYHWPPNLCIALKRFGETENQDVSFPERLPANPTEAACRPLYTLQSVVVHHGASGSGHYTTYCRSDENQWKHFNDAATPNNIDSIECVLNSKAYVLFYRQEL